MLTHLVVAPTGVTKIPSTSVSLRLTRKQLPHSSDPALSQTSLSCATTGLKKPDPTRLISQAPTIRGCHDTRHCNHKTNMTSTPNPQNQTSPARTGNPPEATGGRGRPAPTRAGRTAAAPERCAARALRRPAPARRSHPSARRPRAPHPRSASPARVGVRLPGRRR
jgi:hypothetical protein